MKLVSGHTGVVGLITGLITALGGGCFLPLNLDVEQDPDPIVNTVPVLLQAGVPLSAFGPVVIQRQDQSPVTLTVRDQDSAETTFIYFYVDYGHSVDYDQSFEKPHVNACEVAGPAADRMISCPLDNLCSRIPVADDQPHFLEAIISDRELLSDGDPLFRSFPEAAGISTQAWLMTCVE